MHIVLVGLLLALAFLYFWLLGHWFARIIAFLVFVVLLGGIGMVFTGAGAPPNKNHAWFGLLVGTALAWPLSGLPVYYWRARISKLTRA